LTTIISALTKKHSDEVFAKIALESSAISGLFEDLGYGPWRAANAKHEKKSRKAKKDRN
jgi:hypothetical protein